MNIKSLILDEEALNTAEKETKEKANRKAPVVTYKVEMCSGNDFAISRKTAKTESLMVMIVSQQQYYIKKAGNIEPITKKTQISSFLKDLTSPLELQCDWLGQVGAGNDWANSIFTLISKYSDLISEGFIRITKPLINKYFDSGLIEKKLLKTTIKIMAEYYDIATIRETIAAKWDGTRTFHKIYGNDEVEAKVSQLAIDFYHNANPALKYIENTFGHGGVYEFVKAYCETPVTSFPRSYKISQILAEAEFKLSTFIEYLFSQSVKEGWGDDLNVWLDTWRDSLMLQKNMYGKIQNKYPENLRTYHDTLAYHDRKRRGLQNVEGFESMVKRNTKYEYTGYKFSIVVPKSTTDVIDEGTRLAHCVAGYIPSMASGDTNIFFCRKNNALDTPYVTVEVTSEKQLGQVKGRFNSTPSDDTLDFINQWYETTFGQELKKQMKTGA
jgi:hypothetical protein